MQKTYKIFQDGKTLFSITVTAPDEHSYTDLEWNSKTGLVTAKDENGKTVVLEATGDIVAKIPPKEFSTENISSVDYNIWFY